MLTVRTDFRTGQRFRSEQVSQLEAEIKAIDSKLVLGQRIFATSESSTGYGLRFRVSNAGAWPAGKIRVGGQVQTANLISKAEAVYPPLARQARIQGTVRLEVTSERSGSVNRLQLISGHPLLASSAQEAVRQYRYRPTLLNGHSVEVVTTVDVVFTLP